MLILSRKRNEKIMIGDEISITGNDPVLATRYKIGETCAAVLGGVSPSMNWFQGQVSC